MLVLVLNTGSSSIKYQLFDMADRSVRASGLVERIGEPAGRARHRLPGGGPGGADTEHVVEREIPDHRTGCELIFEAMAATATLGPADTLGGVGHRVVHGGERFTEPVRIDAKVLDEIRAQIPLAPLHNPANLVGIEAMLDRHPDVPQVAVFDTAFHQTMPPHAYRYALPERLYQEQSVRRYGFHGTSYAYVVKALARHLDRPAASLDLVVAHLGNGASISAIRGGRSVDTSMGLSPLEGLVMGTRCGDLDPTVVLMLVRAGLAPDEVETLLNRESGLKGICGDNDMRGIAERAANGEEAATLALEMFCYRVKKYVGSYLAVLGPVDGLVFTAGIGENNSAVRHGVCDGLDHLGIVLDEDANTRREPGVRDLTGVGGRVPVYVVPTDEELEIAEQTLAAVAAG